MTPLPDPWAVVVSSCVWALTSLAVGWWATRWPLDRLRPGPLTRIRSWEQDGGRWQRWFRVRRWKDRVPEAGAFFAGGYAKDRLGSRHRAGLERFRLETVRAERVHWLLLATGPVHLLWCRPTVGLGMIAFGVGFNAPFIVVQRYNRGRLDRLLTRAPS